MKKQDVSDLPLDDLRPLVQRGLQLNEWPGDWDAVGQIIAAHAVSFSQQPMHGDCCALVIDPYAGASGQGQEPLVAIFRAYVLMRWNLGDWERRKLQG